MPSGGHRLHFSRILSAITLQGVPPRLRMACFGAVGAFIGAGLWVGGISNAASYLSDDPKTCINCHVMNGAYESWRHSSHARVASCTDCHVPHESLVAKYAYKAKDGLRHSTVYTMRTEPQVLRATPEAREVIQANCIRCHADLVSESALPLLGRPAGIHDADRSCVECHREVPHGRGDSLSSVIREPAAPFLPGERGRNDHPEFEGSH